MTDCNGKHTTFPGHRISRRLGLVLIIFILGFLAGCSPSSTDTASKAPAPALEPAGDFARRQLEYDRLVRDLHSLNLVNGLHLSREQMRLMIPLLEESARLEDAVRQAKAEGYPRFNETLSDIRDRLEIHNSITDPMQKRLDQVTLAIDSAIARMRVGKDEMAGQVSGILNENQRLMVGLYEPCMVPTPNISNPERIGGVVDSEKFAAELSRLRKMPRDEYLKEREKILSEKKLRMKVFNTDHQINTVIGLMEKAMDASRDLSDLEFEIQKHQLADIPMPQNPRPDIKKDFIIHYLLNPYLLDVYRQRLNNPAWE